MSKKYKIHGFNNLTKTLNMNFYNICYISNKKMKERYIEFINCNYNADNLTDILRNVTSMIGANILNIAKQDYDPQGASASLLISEGEIPIIRIDDSCNRGNVIPNTQHIVGHLDKSHVTVHTYPENNTSNDIFVIRIDIEISTCGEISPLESIDYLIEKFNSNIITIDYRVRGFSRDTSGRKHYIDHKISSIQDFISQKNKLDYKMVDFNSPKNNIFYTKMIDNVFILDSYLFEMKKETLLDNHQIQSITTKIKNEMNSIFFCEE
ncbi:S-adenosylmethionine decarboxylase proenzyme [Vallitalea longa]|uniref:S-adenosylmethionine decarboxylase proenzyme n=1 Tax=Vallitalea longa TaxID=2936439 RepID=A0A9W5YCL1_9FIRM|nr:adenosylmethionine decarboxylase [Vallitalea longa]GKX29888.1 S-adenosylmethionine decarboxylase proenzyme [Vallitalea longa]